MERWKRIARITGIWVFGLAAAGMVGSALGTAITYAYENEAVPGAFGGMFAFACFRLWMGEKRRENSN